MSKPIRERTFVGCERRHDGSLHMVRVVRCADCDQILSSTHEGCCGFSSSGFGTIGHKCPKAGESKGEP